jgi:hypothetical protein
MGLFTATDLHPNVQRTGFLRINRRATGLQDLTVLSDDEQEQAAY